MVVTMTVLAVVGFPIALLVVGAIREHRRNYAQGKPTLLEIHVVTGFKIAEGKGERRYNKAKRRYDVLKNLEK